MIKRSLNFAKKYDEYVSVKQIGEWNGYTVFSPIKKKKGVSFTGYPLKILIKQNEIRWSSPKEALEILNVIEKE